MPQRALSVVPTDLESRLESLPPDEPRSSRLEPFRTFILRWRREGRSYRKIQRILASECSVSVTYETLRSFVKRRARPRKTQGEAKSEQAATVAAEPVPAEQPAPPVTHTNLSPEEAARRRALLQSLRNKPAPATKPAVLPEFCYDEDKPLTIDRTIKD